jgi:hypothetical protein
MDTTSDTMTLVEAIAAAEARALAAHEAGTCQELEWSCSACERIRALR